MKLKHSRTPERGRGEKRKSDCSRKSGNKARWGKLVEAKQQAQEMAEDEVVEQKAGQTSQGIPCEVASTSSGQKNGRQPQQK